MKKCKMKPSIIAYNHSIFSDIQLRSSALFIQGFVIASTQFIRTRTDISSEIINVHVPPLQIYIAKFLRALIC